MRTADQHGKEGKYLWNPERIQAYLEGPISNKPFEPLKMAYGLTAFLKSTLWV